MAGPAYEILQEDGFVLLLEDGSALLTEDQPAAGVPGDGSPGYDLQLEDGFFLLQEDGSYLLLEEQPAVVLRTRPPGGDDAPRSHPGIAPKLVKDRLERRGIDVLDIEAIYDRIHGIEPQTKAEAKALAAVKKAVAPQAAELPPVLDWEAIDNDLKAALAIQRAGRLLADDEDDALVALLLAA